MDVRSVCMQLVLLSSLLLLLLLLLAIRGVQRLYQWLKA